MLGELTPGEITAFAYIIGGWLLLVGVVIFFVIWKGRKKERQPKYHMPIARRNEKPMDMTQVYSLLDLGVTRVIPKQRRLDDDTNLIPRVVDNSATQIIPRKWAPENGPR